MGKFCEECGTQIGDGKSFCTSCGAKVENNGSQQTNNTAQQYNNVQQTNTFVNTPQNTNASTNGFDFKALGNDFKTASTEFVDDMKDIKNIKETITNNMAEQKQKVANNGGKVYNFNKKIIVLACMFLTMLYSYVPALKLKLFGLSKSANAYGYLAAENAFFVILYIIFILASLYLIIKAMFEFSNDASSEIEFWSKLRLAFIVRLVPNLILFIRVCSDVSQLGSYASIGVFFVITFLASIAGLALTFVFAKNTNN